MRRNTAKRNKIISIICVAFLLTFATRCSGQEADTNKAEKKDSSVVIDGETIPEYDGEKYVVLNENEPDFTEEELEEDSFETYGELDELGRCTGAEAVVGEDLMPTEDRGQISEVKPTGWQQKQYDNVEGHSLYNRCHLIAYQLTGENANEKNLITGTRYMNAEGMLPFEEMVGDYVRDTGNHVMYRVTPVFEDENMVASGVQMEAYSIEDDGRGLEYNIYVYNIQPGIEIDYETGENWAEDEKPENKDQNKNEKTETYILNQNSKKFHYPSCDGVSNISKHNKQEFKGTRSELTAQGYEPCGNCNP